LGEIESVLNEHASTQQSVVVARGERGGEKRLIAYVVSDGDTSATTRELRNYLAERLPGYMIPSAFVMLERMPVTASGKIDRNALPLPDWRALADSALTVEERIKEGNESVYEEMVRQIWAGVLGTEQVRREDNFFEIGGHSL